MVDKFSRPKNGDCKSDSFKVKKMVVPKMVVELGYQKTVGVKVAVNNLMLRVLENCRFIKYFLKNLKLQML